MKRAIVLYLLLAGMPAVAQDRKPTHTNVKYGPHERNVMDVWLAKSAQPAPLLVSIHGGGFRGGNKSVSPDLLARCLDSGISVAAITYRLSDQAIAPAQFLDSARAIQFLRHKAKEWNFDPKRVAATLLGSRFHSLDLCRRNWMARAESRNWAGAMAWSDRR